MNGRRDRQATYIGVQVWPAVHQVSPSVLEMRARVRHRRERRQMMARRAAPLPAEVVWSMAVWVAVPLGGVAFWLALGLLIGLRGSLALLAFVVGSLGLWALWPFGRRRS